MAHAMILVKDGSGAAHLHGKQAEGVLRASMGTLKGVFTGVGLVEHPTPVDYSVRMSAACLPGDPTCDVYGLLPIVPMPITAHLPPDEIVLFLLLEVSYGSIEVFGKAVVDCVSVGFDGEVQVAAAYAFGSGRYNVVLELTAKDHEAALRATMQLTDHEAVRHRDVLHIDVPTAQGLGSGRAT